MPVSKRRRWIGNAIFLALIALFVWWLEEMSTPPQQEAAAAGTPLPISPAPPGLFK
ncbi:MAG: hypothetical protein RLZZ126_500 [Pseudomonadota bacterium]|jgi:hypothetical protein